MRTFAAAAGQVRDPDREELTGLERRRAAHAAAMIRVLSDCGLRRGELPGLERSDLEPGWLHVGRTAHDGDTQAGSAASRVSLP